MGNHSINSPFRYAGGKFYARKLILSLIPEHSEYIEPFAGGGSIFFAKGKVDFNQLNDIDEELYNTFLTIRDFPDELICFLTKRPESESLILESLSPEVAFGDPLPAKKELHKFFKHDFNPSTDIERAGRWYYLNRTSYSGIMNIQNMYWGYGDKFSMQPKNWASNIRRASEKLQNTQLTSLDFEEVIDNAPYDSLIFVDPPYFNADQDKFYTHYFNKDDHFRLEECLRRNSHRLKIFLTYDNSSEIKALYHWMNEIHDKEWNYCLNRTDDQRNKGQELFILNYNSEECLVNRRVQLRLEA